LSAYAYQEASSLVPAFKQHGRGCRTALRRLDLAALARDRARGDHPPADAGNHPTSPAGPADSEFDATPDAANAAETGGDPADQGAMGGTPPSAMGGTTPSAMGGTQTKRENQEREPRESARARAAELSPLPEGWRPTVEDVQFARDEGIGRPARVAAAFADYHRARGSLRCDWPAEFRLWCRREREFARPYSRGPRGALEVLGLVDAEEAPEAFIAGYDRRMTDRASGGNHG
jgi:hypothetical protein